MLGERSEPFSLDTTKDKWNKGSSSTSLCPRAGAMMLETRKGAIALKQTNCNSWRCLSCRDRNRNRFKAIVSHGVSILGRCSFITLTYKAGSARLQLAGCVTRDWKAFWRLLNRQHPEYKTMGVLRVMELTKKRTPHYHLILGPLPRGKRVRCWKKEFRVSDYSERMESCACVAHDMARAWCAVTAGESWIVHAVPVTSAKYAGAYLAKYMMKEVDREAMELGMKRRWSTNRAWPSEPRARLNSEGGWKRAMWTEGPPDPLLKWDDMGRVETLHQKAERLEAPIRRLLKLGEQCLQE